MKQHLSKPVKFLSMLALSIATLLSGNVLSDEGKKATQAELNAAIATVNASISTITANMATQAELDAAIATVNASISTTTADMATQAELDAAIATVNSKISNIKPPVRVIGDVLPDGSIVFWVDETGQRGLAAWPFDDAVTNWYGAKEAAENYGPGWRLPTKLELSLLFVQQDVVGGFADYSYWSSTEINVESAWNQGFGNGVQYHYYKYEGMLGVRAVRAF